MSNSGQSPPVNPHYKKLVSMASLAVSETWGMGALHIGKAVVDAIMKNDPDLPRKAVKWDEEHPTDVHFPPGTPLHDIFHHLDTEHADRAPWGYAFSDERPGEMPPRVYGFLALPGDFVDKWNEALALAILDAILPEVNTRLVLVGEIGTKPDGYWLLCEDGFARRFDNHEVYVKYKWEVPGG